jgi:hypothetical protein
LYKTASGSGFSVLRVFRNLLTPVKRVSGFDWHQDFSRFSEIDIGLASVTKPQKIGATFQSEKHRKVPDFA